jgi:hypothetical protein
MTTEFSNCNLQVNRLSVKINQSHGIELYKEIRMQDHLNHLKQCLQ